MRVAGLLLTGGASQRLGIAKSSLVLSDGQTLAGRSARVLADACDIALEVGAGVTGLPTVVEDPQGSGPLVALSAGVAALRERGHTGHVLLLAVDLPAIDPALLGWLARHRASGSLVPRVAGVPQSLCARYAPDALALAEQLVADGDRSMRALLAAARVTYLDEAEWGAICDAQAFDDVDTPDDLERLGLRSPSG